MRLANFRYLAADLLSIRERPYEAE